MIICVDGVLAGCGRTWVAGLVSGSPGSLDSGGQRGSWSNEQRWSDLGEPVERSSELDGPRPVGVDLDHGAALAVADPGGGVQQPVAQLLRLGVGQAGFEEDGLGPGDQVG